MVKVEEIISHLDKSREELLLRAVIVENILAMDENLDVKKVCEHVDNDIMGVEYLIEQLDQLSYTLFHEIKEADCCGE